MMEPGFGKRILHAGFIKRDKDYRLLLLVAPFILFIFMFCYIPIFGWVFSLFNYLPGKPLFKNEFVGLKNYALILKEMPNILRATKNTMIMALMFYATSPVPIIVAVMLNEAKHSGIKKTIQSAITFPNFISWVIVYSLSFQAFSNDGLVSTLLQQFHIIGKPYNIMADARAVYFFQTGLSLWKSTGWSSIIYLAAIAGIDPELYDAATVDGAGRFRKIWNITVPSVMPTYIVIMLISVGIFLSSNIEQYLLFKNPFVAERIEVLDIYIYRMGLLNSDYSYAISIGVIRSVITISLLFIVNYLAKKIRGSSII